MYKKRDLLHFPEFEFKDGSKKAKFFIVLSELENEYVLYNLPTSKQYLSNEDKKPGCIKKNLENGGTISMYMFPEQKIIGENGFYFFKDTYCQFGRGVLKTEKSIIFDMDSEKKDILIKEEYFELMYCFLSSGFLQNRYVPLFEEILDEMS